LYLTRVNWQHFMFRTFHSYSAVLALLSAAVGAVPVHAQRYVCGQVRQNAVQLTAASVYSADAPGFDLNTIPSVTANSCTSNNPFFFSAALPEGNYRVTVVLGGGDPSTTTIWAEARRLMLEKVAVKSGNSVTRSFDVNLRVQEIAGDAARRVMLRPSEIGGLDWDNKLTLEFNGDHPSVRSISIKTIKEPTIYLAGDSTVVDQSTEPWCAWGQMLPRFFRPGVVVANHAESGETIKSFADEQRFEKILSLIQPGDYLFVQFGHNDQKPTGESIAEYKSMLVDCITKVRTKGATPVLVTSMNRRSFDDSGKITNSLAGYPDAVREIAAAQHTALIDLNAMSKILFEAMGPNASMKAFMHFPANAYPNQTAAIDDDTHFNTYGAYELARCVVHGIRADKLLLRKLLIKDIPDFDSSRPDPQANFYLPATPIPAKIKDVMKIPQV